MNGVKGEPPQQARPNTDEITDKLIDKEQKLNYFLVTASTAILVFTFNDFNSPRGLLQSAPLGLVASGWALLIISAVASLYIVREGHKLYRMYIKLRNQGLDEPTPEMRCIVERIYDRRELAERIMIGGFVLGILGLASAYIAAMVRS